MKNPCSKECENRSPTCHGSCEAYLEWMEERRLKREFLKSDPAAGYLKENRTKRRDKYFKNYNKLKRR